MAFTDRLANRGSISTGYDIDNSCVFEGANNEWVYLNSPTAGNRKTFTFSFWFKRSQSKDAIVVWQGTHGRIRFQSDDIRFRFDNGHELETTRKIRDYSAWYHLVIACDSTQGTAANRVKMYVNGVQETQFETATYPDQNDDSALMTTDNLYLSAGDGDFDYSGYIADFCIIDGTQYAASDFGEFDDDSGIWKPKDHSGLTFGSEGVWLKFGNSSSMGTDSSGNSNNFTLTNVDSTNQASDTPTNNFATFNVNVPNSSNCAYTEGGTKVINSASAYRSFLSTIAVTKGKWYAEFNGGNPNDHFGAEVAPTDANGGLVDQSYMSSFTEGIGYYHNGNKYIGDSASSYGNSITNSNLIGCALDMDNGYVYFSKDNTWQNSGDPTSGSSGTGGIALVAASKLHYMGTSNNNTAGSYCNFGGYTALTVSSGNADANGYGNFEHAPPSGFYALCTKNLAEFG